MLLKSINKYTRRFFTFIIAISFISSLFAKTINVLTFGNSFSEDAVEWYLYDIAAADGHEMVIGNLYIGGSNLDNHWGNFFHNSDAYSYRKIVNGIKTTTNSYHSRNAVQDEEWDYISFQQVSGLSGVPSSYRNEHGRFIQFFLEWFHNPSWWNGQNVSYLGNHTKYAFHTTWAYAQSSNHGDFYRYNHDQMQMYNAIISTTNTEISETVSTITPEGQDPLRLSMNVPSGTAIQNARMVLGDNLCRDGFHLNDLGKFVASCTWYQALFGADDPNLDVRLNTYIPAGITPTDAIIAREAAYWAVKYPLQVTDIVNIIEEEDTNDYLDNTINISLGGDAAAGWNSITGYTQGSTLNNLKDYKGNNTTVSMEVTKRFSNINGDGPTSGIITDLDLPLSVVKNNFFGNAELFGVTTPEAEIKFTNLDPDGIYTFTFFASRMGVTDNRQTYYTVTGNNASTSTVYLNPSSNTTTYATTKGILPTANGEITLKVGPGINNNNSYKFYHLSTISINQLKSPSKPLEKTAKISFDDNTTSIHGWNVMSNYSEGSKIYLRDINEELTSASMTITNSFNNVNRDGPSSTTTNLNMPSHVSSRSFFGNATKNWDEKRITKSTLEFSNLDPSKEYIFEMFSSRMDATDNRDTEFIFSGLNSATRNLNASNNTSNTAISPAIKPNAQGKITIDIQKGPGNNNEYGFFYLTAMSIEPVVLGYQQTSTVNLSFSHISDQVNGRGVYGWNRIKGIPIGAQPHPGQGSSGSIPLKDSNDQPTNFFVQVTKPFIEGDRYGRTDISEELMSIFNFPLSPVVNDQHTDHVLAEPVQTLAAYNVGSSGDEREVVFSGLNPNNLYDFTVFGSRQYSGGDRLTSYTLEGNQNKGATTETINTGENTSNYAVISDIQPDVTGKITMTISGTGWFHLNAVRMNEKAVAPENTTINISLGEGEAAGWNLLTGYTDTGGVLNTRIDNLINEDDLYTSVSVEITERFAASDTNGRDGSDGLRAWPEELHIPETLITKSNLHGRGDVPESELTFTGLNPDKLYDFVVYGSQISDITDIRWTYHRFEGRKYADSNGDTIDDIVYLNVVNNNDKFIVARDIQPTEEGVIVMKVGWGGNSPEHSHMHNNSDVTHYHLSTINLTSKDIPDEEDEFTDTNTPIKVSFGSGLNLESEGWNTVWNWLDGTGVNNLININNEHTPVNLNIISRFNEAQPYGPEATSTALNMPKHVSRLSFFGTTRDWAYYNADEAVIEFSGLEPNAKYDFEVFAAGYGDSLSYKLRGDNNIPEQVYQNRGTKYIFSGAINEQFADSLDATNNVSNTVKARAIQADAQGKILMRVSASADNNSTNPNNPFFSNLQEFTNYITQPGNTYDERILKFYYLTALSIVPSPITPPTILPEQQIHDAASVEISIIADSGDQIHYTTDGSDPKTSGTKQQYSAAFTIPIGNTLIQAYTKNSREESEVVFRHYAVSTGTTELWNFSMQKENQEHDGIYVKNGLAFSKDGKRIYRGARNTNAVAVFNAETGNYIKHLTQNHNSFNPSIGGDVAVDDNGGIYACNVVYQSSSSLMVLYWSEENASPSVLISTQNHEAKGDADSGYSRIGYGMDVYKDSSGDGFILMHLNGTDKLQYWEISNHQVSNKTPSSIPILTTPSFEDMYARISIVDKNHFWISGHGSLPTYCTITRNSGQYSVPTSVSGERLPARSDINMNIGGATEFEFKGKRYGVFAVNNHNNIGFWEGMPKHYSIIQEYKNSDGINPTGPVIALFPLYGMGKLDGSTTDWSHFVESSVKVFENAEGEEDRVLICSMGGHSGTVMYDFREAKIQNLEDIHHYGQYNKTLTISQDKNDEEADLKVSPLADVKYIRNKGSKPTGEPTQELPNSFEFDTGIHHLKYSAKQPGQFDGLHNSIINVGPYIWQGKNTANWSSIAEDWKINTYEQEQYPNEAVNAVIIPSTLSGNKGYPTLTTDVEISSLKIESGAKLTIDTEKSISVCDTIYNIAGTSGLLLKAQEGKRNAALIFNKTNSEPVHATVEMYSPAEWDLVDGKITSPKWQYFGIPFTELGNIGNTFAGSIIRQYNPSGKKTSILPDDSGRWVQLTNNSRLLPIQGYEIAQPGPRYYSFSGELFTNDINRPVLFDANSDYPGQNVLSNPYTAPINIKNIVFDANTEAAVYVYNTGSYAQWENIKVTASTDDQITPGQYVATPQELSGVAGILDEIPSMQGFVVRTKEGVTNSGNISFSYDSFTFDYLKNTTRLQRAPQQTYPWLRLTLEAENAGDVMWLFMHPETTADFDNGWDGRKMGGDTGTAMLFSHNETGNYQINTMDDIDDTQIAFRAGADDTQYTITVNSGGNIMNYYSKIYLEDKLTGEVVDITEDGKTYSFHASGNQISSRFKITSSPAVQSGTEDVFVYTDGQKLFINNASDEDSLIEVFDMIGRKIINYNCKSSEMKVEQPNLPKGSYVVRIMNSETRSKKIVIK